MWEIVILAVKELGLPAVMLLWLMLRADKLLERIANGMDALSGNHDQIHDKLNTIIDTTVVSPRLRVVGKQAAKDGSGSKD